MNESDIAYMESVIADAIECCAEVVNMAEFAEECDNADMGSTIRLSESASFTLDRVLRSLRAVQPAQDDSLF